MSLQTASIHSSATSHHNEGKLTATTVSTKPSVTLACCVESGPLETTTLMMIESLRRWGGRFATIPVTAVTPRFGPPLMSATRRRLDELGVQYVRKNLSRGTSRKFTWYSFLNKPLAIAVAEETATTDTMLWLDADVLVTGEPTAFDLPADVDFVACPSDCNLGSTGPGDKFEPYWAEMCRVLGLSMDQLPWVNTCRENSRIHVYFNGGVLAFRRSSGYATHYLDSCVKVLDSRISSRDARLFFAEQVTVGLVAIKMGLNWRNLPEQFNYALGSKAMDGFDPTAFSQARVLHYHDAMWGHFYPRFLDLCKISKPELFEFLRDNGVLTNRAGKLSRLVAKGLHSLRTKRQAAHERQCVSY